MNLAYQICRGILRALNNSSSDVVLQTKNHTKQLWKLKKSTEIELYMAHVLEHLQKIGLENKTTAKHPSSSSMGKTLIKHSFEYKSQSINPLPIHLFAT